MEDMPVYYDEGQGVYRLFEVDEDSGVEELPLSSFLKMEEDAYTQTAMATRTSSRLSGSNCDFEDDDLTYIDDETDADYKPNALTYMKKGKSKYHRRYHQRYLGDSRQMLLLTPEKQMSGGGGAIYNSDCESVGGSSMRHYARKDRTPRTIMKMMERHRESESDCESVEGSSMGHYARKDRTPGTIMKMMERHRESERVRHHTLNESMKDVCLRVPGYDPDVKETKVIQMQRIIGYECFLENTLNSLCSQLGLPTKVLKLGTNFITDAMKDTPIEDFYQPSNYKTSDVDDEDEEEEEDNELVPPNRNLKPPTRCRTANSSAMEKNIIRYRRDKLPSLTVNSGSDGQVKIYSLAQSPHRSGSGNQSSDGDNEDWLPALDFVSPLELAHNQWSQDSGIKIETPEEEEEQSFNDIDSLIEHGLCQDPEHLKSVTASFMKEEPGVSQEDNEAFQLSSPPRSSDHSFIFLRSPRARGIWHPEMSAHNDTLDTLNSREMQTVSPENVLETKTGITSTANNCPRYTPFSADQNSPTMEMVRVKTEVEDDCTVPDMSANQSPFSNDMTATNEFTSTKSLTQIGCSGSRHFNVTNFNSSRLGLNMATTSSANVQAQSAAESLPGFCTNSQSREFRAESLPGFCTIDQSKESRSAALPGFRTNGHSKESRSAALPGLRTNDHNMTTPLYAVMENGPQGRNKRKRYTPFRAPLMDICNQQEVEEEGDDRATAKFRKSENLSRIPDPTLAENFCTRSGLERKAAGKKSTGVKHSSGGDAIPAKVDHRRSSWMNGFMMFCQKNRAQLVRDNPGVHNSHIQKMLGQMWRNMSPDDQEPYRAKAKQCSSYLKRVHDSLFTEFTESIVDTCKGGGGSS